MTTTAKPKRRVKTALIVTLSIILLCAATYFIAQTIRSCVTLPTAYDFIKVDLNTDAMDAFYESVLSEHGFVTDMTLLCNIETLEFRFHTCLTQLPETSALNLRDSVTEFLNDEEVMSDLISFRDKTFKRFLNKDGLFAPETFKVDVIIEGDDYSSAMLVGDSIKTDTLTLYHYYQDNSPFKDWTVKD